MPESAELEEPPEEVLDGVTVARTETGDHYTVTVEDDGNLTFTGETGDDVRPQTPSELDMQLRQGEFYIPEDPAWEVQTAIDQLVGGRDE